MHNYTTPRNLQVVNSASSNLMHLDLALFESYDNNSTAGVGGVFYKNARTPIKARGGSPGKHQNASPSTQTKQQIIRSFDKSNASKEIQDSLRKQVRRNLKLIEAIHRNTEGLTPSGNDHGGAGGAVLKVQAKEIAQTNRERTLGERARFYKNKQGRWAFYPKLEKSEILKEALAQRGISPQDIQMLHQLTEASIALTMKNRQIMNDSEVKKHTSLPITQAIMSQKMQPTLQDKMMGPYPQKSIVYSTRPIQRNVVPINRSFSNNRSIEKDQQPPNFCMPTTQMKQTFSGSNTQRFLPQQTPRELISAESPYRFANNLYQSQQMNASPMAQSPPFGQYLEQMNNSAGRLHTTVGKQRNGLLSAAAGQQRVSLNNMPLKTAMIKYRENKIAEAEAMHHQGAVSYKNQKLLETLKPFSNSALQDRVVVQVTHNHQNDEEELRPMTSARDNKKLTTTVKPFFDPELTYQPPKQREFIVPQGDQPRKRLKELYKHYQAKGDYYITSQFLRRRDWIDPHSRLNQLKLVSRPEQQQ